MTFKRTDVGANSVSNIGLKQSLNRALRTEKVNFLM